MNSQTGIVDVMRSLVGTSEAFIEIADMLRSLPGVLSVDQPCWMRRETQLGENQFLVGEGLGFRIEWYADAMFNDGRSLSFAEQVAWHDEEWTIEATVTLRVGDDEKLLVEFPTRHAVEPDDLVVELDSQTQLLLNSQDSATRLFGG